MTPTSTGEGDPIYTVGMVRPEDLAAVMAAHRETCPECAWCAAEQATHARKRNPR